VSSHDGAHAGQGEARFGDIGREHDAAPAGCGCERGALPGQCQFAMQRHAFDVARQVCQGRARPLDFALARQEDEHVAGVLGECQFHRAANVQRPAAPRPGFAWTRGRVRDAHGETASLARDARRIEPARDTLAGERRRHQHEAQVGPERALHVEGERGPEVAVEMALVELVEEDGAGAGAFGILLQHARQDALGHHFDARRRGHRRFETDAVADGRAHRFAQLRRHESGGCARGDAARLQHQDPASGEPWRIEQGERNPGCLAGARRRFKHQARMRRQRSGDGRQHGVDRQGRSGHRRVRSKGAPIVGAARCANENGAALADRAVSRADGSSYSQVMPLAVNRRS
jgi:hypothetical protein